MNETAQSCPVFRLDPFSAEFTADPHSTFSAARKRGPVVYDDLLDMYVVSDYGDVEQILADTQTFSSANVVRPVCPVGEAASEILAEFHVDPVLANSDPPRHPLMRRVTARRLTPKRMRRLEREIRFRANDLVESMSAEDLVDFSAEVAFPLPAYTGLTLIGYPNADIESLKEWSRDRVQLNWGCADPEHQAKIARNLRAHWDYTQRFVMDRLADPRDDMTSELIEAHRVDPDGLTLNEVISIIFTVTTAAHESTTNAILNAVHALLTHRDQYEMLCRDATLIPNAVEEALRYAGSVISWRRVTARATTVHGVPVPSGAQVLMLLGSANRDPGRFDEPASFDITRPNAATHLTFGRGSHYCLGASLARLQMQVLLEVLTQKAPRLALVPDREVSFVPNLSHRGPAELWVLPRG